MLVESLQVDLGVGGGEQEAVEVDVKLVVGWYHPAHRLDLLVDVAPRPRFHFETGVAALDRLLRFGRPVGRRHVDVPPGDWAAVADFGAEQGVDRNARVLTDHVEHRDLRPETDAVVVHDGVGIPPDQVLYGGAALAVAVTHKAVVGLDLVEVETLGVGVGALHGGGHPFGVEGNVEGGAGGVEDLHGLFSSWLRAREISEFRRHRTTRGIDFRRRIGARYFSAQCAPTRGGGMRLHADKVYLLYRPSEAKGADF